MNEREALLKKLSAYAFAVYDWNLYLDTHPHEKDAIAMYHKMADRAKELQKEFVAKYGPITATEVPMDAEHWSWINNPWPWDNV